MAPSAERIRDFKVIIAGGGIGGLTLAHALTKVGIDFVLLEARSDFAPQQGASVGILAHGGRILDQLGVWDSLFKVTVPLVNGSAYTPDGRLFHQDDSPNLMARRMGYPMAFMQRQLLLQTLYETTTPETKARMFTEKRVEKVLSTSENVTVYCKDGSSYTGDIVVGADGVHSKVREQMRKHVAKFGPPGMMDKDEKSMTTEYELIFGMAKPWPTAMVPDMVYRTFGQNYSILTARATDDVMTWFLFIKLDKRYPIAEAPRPKDRATTDKKAAPYLKAHVNDTVKLQSLYENTETVNHVLLEESANEHWTFDRFVLMGDSVCKMTPNLGAGGNSAIESAAVLVNHLDKIAHSNPDFETVKETLHAYQSTRRDAANAVLELANNVTRIEAQKTWMDRVLAHYIVPKIGDYFVDSMSGMVSGAACIEGLPAGPLSYTASMPFDAQFGITRQESIWKRALMASPLLVLSFLAGQYLTDSFTPAVPEAFEMMESGTLHIADQKVQIESFGGSAVIRFFVGLFMVILGDFNRLDTLQLLTFLVDLLPVLVVLYIESIRRSNFLTFASIPLLFGVLYQLLGLGRIGPIYFFIHYVQSSTVKLHAADNRLTTMKYTKVLLPALFLSYLPPTILMFNPLFSMRVRQYLNAAWQFFPLIASVVVYVFGRFTTDTTLHDRIHNFTADMPYLRLLYSTTAAIAGTTFLMCIWMSDHSPWAILFKGVTTLSHLPTQASLANVIVLVLRYDHIFSVAGWSLWVLLSFYDLKRVGKLHDSWVKIVGALVGSTLVVGPGASLALMWWWREETLALHGLPRAPPVKA